MSNTLGNLELIKVTKKEHYCSLIETKDKHDGEEFKFYLYTTNGVSLSVISLQSLDICHRLIFKKEYGFSSMFIKDKDYLEFSLCGSYCDELCIQTGEIKFIAEEDKNTGSSYKYELKFSNKILELHLIDTEKGAISYKIVIKDRGSADGL